jgi:hypothetical protein
VVVAAMRLAAATLLAFSLRPASSDGYVVVRQAFSRADGLAMERRWWSELEGAHAIRRDDRASWHQITGDLKAAKRDPLQAATGRSLVTFPGRGAWELPTRHWHWDNPGELHLDRLRGYSWSVSSARLSRRAAEP